MEKTQFAIKAAIAISKAHCSVMEIIRKQCGAAGMNDKKITTGFLLEDIEWVFVSGHPVGKIIPHYDETNNSICFSFEPFKV